MQVGLSAQDKVLALTTICFDIAGLEIYLPLFCGGTLHIASQEQAGDPDELTVLIDSFKPSLMQATPTTWRMLLRNGWRGCDTLDALCGGEAMPQELLEDLLPRVKTLRNVYGPTETTIWSTVWNATAGKKVQIGKPIKNTTVRCCATDLFASCARQQCLCHWLQCTGHACI
jgi:non-ribosomal peptide synthetase component F